MKKQRNWEVAVLRFGRFAGRDLCRFEEIGPAQKAAINAILGTFSKRGTMRVAL
jgi:hypothetical protein